MNFGNHPCFDEASRHSAARIHLPVAEKCNVQCNFCNRRYDCVNESRPGVTSAVLSPRAAADYLDAVSARLEGKTPVSVIGVAGPGDPFAAPEETLETLRLVRERYPDKVLCVATNGLNLAPYAESLAALKVSHVTVTLNAVESETGAKIYAWVRKEPKIYRDEEGAKVLLENQTDAIRALKARGVMVKINTVVIPGVNDTHIAAVAEYAVSLGADVQNCIPMMHVEGTAFEHIPAPDAAMMARVRREAAAHLAQMSHCARCRADAAGLVGRETPAEFGRFLAGAAVPSPTAEKPFVAVASMEGLFVNRHLGEAAGLWVFGLEDGKLALREQRPTPEPGSGDRRWEELAGRFSDCFAILTANCGANPKRILEAKGIRVVAGEGLIAETAAPLLSGSGIPKVYAPRCGDNACGSGCGGDGMGCGA
ncbi:MAG: nitrogenase cofactor biosynthesis protein NifB [Treponematales bacterium]